MSFPRKRESRASNEFKITDLGTGWLEKSLIYIFIAFWAGICFIVARSQRHIYKLDMEIKARQD